MPVASPLSRPRRLVPRVPRRARLPQRDRAPAHSPEESGTGGSRHSAHFGHPAPLKKNGLSELLLARRIRKVLPAAEDLGMTIETSGFFGQGWGRVRCDAAKLAFPGPGLAISGGASIEIAGRNLVWRLATRDKPNEEAAIRATFLEEDVKNSPLIQSLARKLIDRHLASYTFNLPMGIDAPVFEGVTIEGSRVCVTGGVASFGTGALPFAKCEVSFEVEASEDGQVVRTRCPQVSFLAVGQSKDLSLDKRVQALLGFISQSWSLDSTDEAEDTRKDKDAAQVSLQLLDGLVGDVHVGEHCRVDKLEVREGCVHVEGRLLPEHQKQATTHQSSHPGTAAERAWRAFESSAAVVSTSPLRVPRYSCDLGAVLASAIFVWKTRGRAKTEAERAAEHTAGHRGNAGAAMGPVFRRRLLTPALRTSACVLFSALAAFSNIKVCFRPAHPL